MPSLENVKVECVSFIGVMFGYGERSWYIGWARTLFQRRIMKV